MIVERRIAESSLFIHCNNDQCELDPLYVEKHYTSRFFYIKRGSSYLLIKYNDFKFTSDFNCYLCEKCGLKLINKIKQALLEVFK